jgi:membrane associated rhomboid family serine protease
MATKRYAAILLSTAGFASLTAAEFNAANWRLALFATWFALNSAAAVLFTMSKKKTDRRRRRAPHGGAEQRDPSLLALTAAALAIGIAGGSLMDGAVGVGAAVLSAGCFTGWLYSPRLRAARWRNNS